MSSHTGQDAAAPASPEAGAGTRAGSRLRGGWGARAEDWLLAAWTAVVAPALLGAGGTPRGLFDSGRPLAGLLGIVAVLGAAVCLASRRPAAGAGVGMLGSAAIGPFVGGVMLLSISTATALGLEGAAVIGLFGAVIAVAVLARLLLPAPSVVVRRALVTPYLLAAGGLFWAAIDAVTAGGDVTAAVRRVAPADPGSVLPIAGFLLAFSGVFYAMLVYAPRQVAEREGDAITWLVRYGLFAASVMLGASWLLLLGS